MIEINKLIYFLESRKIFDSPFANHFSPVAQISPLVRQELFDKDALLF
jgi:hypothetical protein